jgi:multicomponent Na+:H+ antiporter subunit E
MGNPLFQEGTRGSMTADKTFRILRVTFLTVLCLAIWLLVSQDTGAVSVIAGSLFAMIASVISNDAFFEKHVLHRSDFLVRLDLVVLFSLIIVVQSYISSIDIIVRMLRRDYRPGIVRIRTRISSPVGRSVLANTISLIPGTLSLWLDDRHIYVHWFDKKTHHSHRARSLITGRIEPLLLRIFG